MKAFTVGKIIFAVGILAFILWNVGVAEIAATMVTINPLYLGLSYLMLVLSILINATNFKILFSPLKRIPFKTMLKNYSFSWSLGLLTPGKLGEFSLAYFIKEIPLGKSSAIIVLEKIVAVGVLVLFSVTGIALLFSTSTMLIPVLVFIILLFAMACILLSSAGRSFLKRFVFRKYSRLFAGFSETLFSYMRKRKRLLASNTVFACLKWLVISLIAFVLFSGIGQPVPAIYMLAIVPLSALISMIPVSISGLGLREGSFVLLCSLIGIPIATSTAVALLSVIIDYTSVFAIFTILLTKTKLSLKDIGFSPGAQSQQHYNSF